MSVNIDQEKLSAYLIVIVAQSNTMLLELLFKKE